MPLSLFFTLTLLFSLQFLQLIESQSCGIQHAPDPLDLGSQFPPAIPYRRSLLSQSESEKNRILGGIAVNDANTGQVCWQAYLTIKNSLPQGAIIIGPQTVLIRAGDTFVQSVNGSGTILTQLTPADLIINVGANGVNKSVNPTFFPNCGGTKAVQSFVIHPDFDYASRNNNIAVVTLKEPLDLNQSCLCAICLSKSAPKLGETCAISGLGDEEFTNRSAPFFFTRLKFIKLRIIPNKPDQCAFATKMSDTTNALCAVGSDNQGACFGDAGAPLACWDQTRRAYYVAGILNFVARDAARQCNPSQASSYLALSSYYDWIVANSQGKLLI